MTYHKPRNSQLVLHWSRLTCEWVLAESEPAISSCSTPWVFSPLHMWGLCVDLVLSSVLCVQQFAGLEWVLALQPVLIQGFQGWVQFWQSNRHAAVHFLHLLDQSFIEPTFRLSLCLTSATQAPWGGDEGGKQKKKVNIASTDRFKDWTAAAVMWSQFTSRAGQDLHQLVRDTTLSHSMN